MRLMGVIRSFLRKRAWQLWLMLIRDELIFKNTLELGD
jgi:hypothetical protein